MPGLRHPRTFGFIVSRAAGRQLRSRQETVVSQGAAGVPSGVGPESHPGAPVTSRVRTGRPPGRCEGSLASQLVSFSLGHEAQSAYLRNGTLK